MYQQPFKGVGVAESEPALLEATQSDTFVLHATARGCGGILQAITHFGFLGDEGIDAHANPSHETGKSDLVIVYHRLPYEEFFENGKLIRRRSEEHTSELQSLIRISYAVFCCNKKINMNTISSSHHKYKTTQHI